MFIAFILIAEIFVLNSWQQVAGLCINLSAINKYEIRSPTVDTLHNSFPVLWISQVDGKKAEDAKVYLTLPATWTEVEEKERQTGKQFHHTGAIAVTKDSFQIASLTCSTKLTQNGNI